MPTREATYSCSIMRVGMTNFHREEYQDYHYAHPLPHEHLDQLYPVPKSLEKLYDGSRKPKFMIWHIGKGDHWKNADDEVKKGCTVWTGL